MRPRLRYIVAFLTLVAFAKADDLPEIVRLRVPSDGIKAIFPAGTELRGMLLDEFESLVSAAKNAERASPRGPAATLLRAAHQARWENGVLIGKSELLVESPAATASLVAIEPWSPAIVEAPKEVVLAIPNHPLALKSTGPGSKIITLNWEQVARTGTEGRSFDLGLPAGTTCRLTLDLPQGVVPEIGGTIRQGPAPGSAADRRAWRFDGRGGLARLNLHAATASDLTVAPVWISGITVVDASESPPRWTWNGSVDPGAAVTRRFSLVLDAGLEVLDVAGPGVASYRIESLPDQRNSVSIRLSDSVSGPTPVTIRALGQAISEGGWIVPAFHPQDAIWTGGRTVLKLGPGQSVSTVRPLAARQSTLRVGERELVGSRPGLSLAFESFAPGSPAEILWNRSSFEASSEVRGQIFLSRNDAPRLTVRVSWRLNRGRLATLAADIPAGWSPEKVQLVGTTVSTAWHSEARPGGGTRLVVHPPPSIGIGGVTSLDISAVVVGFDRASALDLPRILPVGGHVDDEIWTLQVEPGLMATPRQARGLSWLDPATLEPAKIGPLAPMTAHSVLAWRWTTGDGRGSLFLSSSPTRPAVEAWTAATIRADRIIVDYHLAIELRGRPAAELAVGFVGQSAELPRRWAIVGEVGKEIETAPVAAADREAVGLPAGVQSVRIVLPRTGRDRIVLHSRTEQPWSGSGAVPLMVLPSADLARATLLVNIDRGLAAEVTAGGLAVRDAGWATAARLQAVGAVSVDAAKSRATLAYGYDTHSAAPSIQTKSLLPAASGGVIEEAGLFTTPSRKRRSAHRLELRIRPGAERVVDVSLPEGCSLERAEIEGHSVVPAVVGGSLRFPLPATASSRPTIEMELDYRGSLVGEPNRVQPQRPQISMPCLAFSWTLDLNPSEKVTLVQGNLVAIDLPPTTRPETTLADRAALEELDQRVRQSPPDGLNLAGWLKMLDGGQTPIVIDRPSLASAGWGPRTPLTGSRASSATLTFANLGLSIVARGGCVLISDISKALESRQADPAAVRLAAELGHDEFDRYQSVARWRGEPTPNPGRERPTLSRSSEPEPTGSVSLVSSNWPLKVAAVQLDERDRGRTLGIAIVAGLALGAILMRPRSPRVRAVLLALVLTGGVCAASFGQGRVRESAGPLLWAGCIVSGLWLGSAFRPRRTRRSHRGDRSNSVARQVLGTSVGSLVLLVVFLSQAPARQVAAPPGKLAADSGPIIVLLPYDPPLDPSVPASRVILRLADHDRLLALCESRAPRVSNEPSLTGALHEMRREGARDARVASAFDLWSNVAGPVTWTFPTELARDLSATLDGHDIPLRIGEGGSTASVEIVGEGPHRLIVKRLIALSRSGEGDALSMAIPAIATSHLRIETPADGPAVDVPSAAGRVHRKDTILEAALGPAASLEVRWSNQSSIGPHPPRGVAEATILWDVEPAGDRVRARITSRSAEGLDHLTFALEPGLLVRSVERGGSTEAVTRPGSSGSRWTITFEPALAAGQSFRVEFWKPLVGNPASTLRDLPRFEVLGLAELSGLIGVRRPLDWTGRSAPMAGQELVADDLFARAWGPFPDASATFAGASRFVNSPAQTLNVGPSHDRPRIVPSVQVEIVPGRFEIRAQAEVSEEAGRLRELSATIPSDLKIARVESAGLTDWSRPSDSQLRFRFDNDTAAPHKTIRVIGWVPIDSDPMIGGTLKAEAEVPWPAWLGSDVATGTLDVASPVNVGFQLEPRAGVNSTSPAPVPSGSVRSSFLVAPGAIPGKLGWTAEPTGVTVRIQSLLTLYPDSVEWIASARYGIPAGPCPPIRLRLPSEWARTASVEINGVAVPPVLDISGAETSMTIRPGSPCWGSARVIVRATRSRKPGDSLSFPDLVPLGRPRMDRADSYVAYVDASGSPTIVEGSAELQEVDTAKWDAADLSWPPGPSRHAFRVIKEGWSLKFLDSAAPRSYSEGAEVRFADLEGVLDEQGVFLGRASYELDPRSAPFLIVSLRGGSETLAASVDGQIVVPRHDREGRILIPLGEGARHATLIWRGPVLVRDSLLPLPTLPGQSAPMLLSVAAPDRSRFSAGHATVAVAASVRDQIRAERQAQNIVERLKSFDRGSTRDRANLLASLIRFELDARSAERASQTPNSPGRLTTLSTARLTLEDALATAGLEEFGRSAAARTGGEAADPLATQPAALDPPELLRLRPIGRTFVFRDTQGSANEQDRPLVRWNAGSLENAEIRNPSRLASFLFALLPWTAIPWVSSRPRLTALAFAVSATWAVLAPLGGLATVGLLLLGMLPGFLLRRPAGSGH
jgi:hypothetical protein